MLIGVDSRTSVRDLLWSTCAKRHLNPHEHYVRIKPMGSVDDKFVIPSKQDIVKNLVRLLHVYVVCLFYVENVYRSAMTARTV